MMLQLSNMDAAVVETGCQRASIDEVSRDVAYRARWPSTEAYRHQKLVLFEHNSKTPYLKARMKMRTPSLMLT